MKAVDSQIVCFRPPLKPEVPTLQIDGKSRLGISA
jgi:hypothetical protein